MTLLIVLSSILTWLIIGWGLTRYYILPGDRKRHPTMDVLPVPAAMLVNLVWPPFLVGTMIANLIHRCKNSPGENPFRKMYGIS
jgi:hypothetical protein